MTSDTRTGTPGSGPVLGTPVSEGPASEVRSKALAARAAARRLAVAPTGLKNQALELMAARILQPDTEAAILTANARDLETFRRNPKHTRALEDRLTINRKRLEGMAEGLRQVASLPDPVGEVTAMWTRPNGLQIGQVRVPMGVVGLIYEARPNVTVDAAGLTLKAGSACLLRGGSEALESNRALAAVLQEAVEEAGLPAACIGLIETADRAAAVEMMRANGLIDVLIPRGGAGLIRTVVENSTVPVIETGVGNCHVYVDEGADLEMARRIILNAKCSRPAVCNAAETLLVHRSEAAAFLPAALAALRKAGVELRGCPEAVRYHPEVKDAVEDDWYAEFLDLILAVRVVRDLEEAVAHIDKYGSRHSEAIVTRDYARARRFLAEVDSAAVYVNASTRFTDGFEFGLGAEIGISTQKLHARGPMGLRELTTTKFIIFGDGQVRD